MKKIMIKILAVLMVCVCGFCGCGSGQSVEESGGPVAEDFDPKSEVLQSGVFDGIIQFGINTVSLPCGLNILLDEGASILDSGYSKDYLMEAGKSSTISVSLYGEEFEVTVCNTTDDVLRAGDCSVTALLKIHSPIITLPRGIRCGISSYEDLCDLWGEGIPVSGEEDETLDFSYYKESSEAKRLFPYKTTSEPKMIYSINGCRCQVSFDRETGILSGADIYFCEKYGTETFDSLTYYGDGGQAVFDILKDACSVEDNEHFLYCMEEIDGKEYIIATGVGNLSLDRREYYLSEIKEALMEEDDATESVTEEDLESPDESTDVEDCTEDAGDNTEDTTVLLPIVQEYLCYGDFDVTADAVLMAETEDTVFYGGTQLTDSLYLNMRACFKEHAAVSLICYLYPVDEGEQVSAEAAAFMDKYMERISSSLEFVFSE